MPLFPLLIVLGILAVCFHWVLKKSQWTKVWVRGICGLILFVAIYLVLDATGGLAILEEVLNVKVPRVK